MSDTQELETHQQAIKVEIGNGGEVSVYKGSERSAVVIVKFKLTISVIYIFLGINRQQRKQQW